jgi:hypothetical protein
MVVPTLASASIASREQVAASEGIEPTASAEPTAPAESAQLGSAKKFIAIAGAGQADFRLCRLAAGPVTLE